MFIASDIGVPYLDSPHVADNANGTPSKLCLHFPVRLSSTTLEVCLDGLALDREGFLFDHALICRFTKTWPKLCDLHGWVSNKWKAFVEDEISIFPCAKGFFILEFESKEDKELVLENGPWFYEGDFLCMKPWFPEFDPHTKIFTTTFLWVRLPHLPIQFWELDCLRAIGNSLGRYHCSSEETINYQNSTCACICIEMDFANGLPSEILLKVGNRCRRQPIDYEKIAFRCRKCFSTKHISSQCQKDHVVGNFKPSWWIGAESQHYIIPPIHLRTSYLLQPLQRKALLPPLPLAGRAFWIPQQGT